MLQRHRELGDNVDDSMNSSFRRSLLVLFLLMGTSSLVASHDSLLYDSTAYTKCKGKPERALYNGGILKDIEITSASNDSSPSFMLLNLTQGTKYSFSSWVKIDGVDSALIRASLTTENEELSCIGNVVARSGCWSFLKGGFTLSSSPSTSTLSFQGPGNRDISIAVASVSLQPFTDEQWSRNQQRIISKVRKRPITIHVSDGNGERLQGVDLRVEQISKEFPFGSAIAKSILGNIPYQKWFVERFNTVVFENELKWSTTEPEQGKINYTIADQMLKFVRESGVMVRGHNIFWENPNFVPAWVKNLTGSNLEKAVNARITSLMDRYKEEFVHWDVNNEMLHFDFFEQRLGPNASLDFFKVAHESDPLATLFMNEFNVVETCDDNNSSVDGYISRLRELKRGGVSMDGIGLQGHFSTPNLPLMRAVIDKLATLGLPIWLTEVDISDKFDMETQAVYLEQVLREGFSHPSVNGIMMWTAIRLGRCFRMCLTDTEYQNLPAGDVVDKLLREWTTKDREGRTDKFGSYSFFGFLGEYLVTLKHGNRTVKSTFALSHGIETMHVTIHL
ncbi:endo-1,4-beta-xylanase 5-like isoform X1 [Punica granatum]|uniref:Endo-1,4-beta-xylanase 5-like isoform X1 n=3 Tax=Punica granatum TaxID=22663 RepID=A0A6P8D1Q7_PUNGR|nr:endo-1,4-beta-xylanase 5-like isoform X1 [Punica granatum]